MTLLAEANGAQVHCCDWRALLPVVEAAGGCDLLCVDAPYSDRIHAGHFSGTLDTDEHGRDWLARRGYDDKRTRRRPLSYSSWSAGDVLAFVATWAQVTRGWMVSVTDHVLSPAWEQAMREADRYTFAPLPFYEEGKQPRLTGDGPASWTCWIVVSRPKSRAFSSWGSLPGGYSTREKDQNRIPGGKPIRFGCELIRDYSRPGDLVVDPCCGGGTFGVAAIRQGRRAIVGDANREHAEIAAQWIRHPYRVAPGTRDRTPAGQVPLFGGAK